LLTFKNVYILFVNKWPVIKCIELLLVRFKFGIRPEHVHLKENQFLQAKLKL
jgi:hypothetical protein